MQWYCLEDQWATGENKVRQITRVNKYIYECSEIRGKSKQQASNMYAARTPQTRSNWMQVFQKCTYGQSSSKHATKVTLKWRLLQIRLQIMQRQHVVMSKSSSSDSRSKTRLMNMYKIHKVYTVKSTDKRASMNRFRWYTSSTRQYSSADSREHMQHEAL